MLEASQPSANGNDHGPSAICVAVLEVAMDLLLQHHPALMLPLARYPEAGFAKIMLNPVFAVMQAPSTGLQTRLT